MKNFKIQLTGTPPRIIPILLKGFNTIANHIYLILLPVVMDLVLWFGPKLRLKALFMPSINEVSNQMLKISPPELVETVKTSVGLWEKLLSQFNLLTALRTFPIGVPSLIARESPISSPLTNDLVFEVTSTQWVVIILILATIIGFLLGTLYFYLIARITAPQPEKMTIKEILNAFVQSLLMFCLLIAVALLVSVPLVLIISVLSLVNMNMGQLFVFVAAFALLWLVMPLIFAPHGMFVLKQKAMPSMLLSIRLVRIFLPGTGLFIMTSALISEGLNMLWTMPGANSWLTLLGIGGHSFIVTGLLAASFFYYRDGLKWMQENIQKAAAAAQQNIDNGGTNLEQQ